MDLQTYERVLATTGEVVANVKADQLDDPTPCTKWKVRDLVNHIVGGNYFFAAAAESGAAQPPEGEPPDFTGGDIAEAFDASRQAALQAWSKEGALDRTVVLPFGEMPGRFAMGIHLMDSFQHAWDLAKATRQSTDLDRELATAILGQAAGVISDDWRGEGRPFGAAVDVPDDAPPADKLAGFFGRTP